MKNVLMVVLLLMTFVLAGATVFAEADIEITGEVRVRTEGDDKTFVKGDKMNMTTWLRTRLAVEATMKNNTHAFIQFQDSRMAGDVIHYDGDLYASGTTNDGKNVDLHQAYIQIDKLWWDGFGVKAGRFEMKWGNQRVFSPAGWSNVGKSWEGVQKWYDHDKFKITAFVLKKVELSDETGNRDFDVMGLKYNCKKLGMDVFGIYEYDANKTAINKAAVKRWSIGTYYFREHNHMDYTLNAVMQTGTTADDVAETDVSAYMINFEAGYNFDSETKPRLAIGVDLTSGDDDNADDKNKAYSDLYGTGHGFQGYMDLFKVNDGNGLMDIMLKASCNPWEKWWMGLDFHYFQTAVDYTYDDSSTKDVGMEFDFTVKTKSVDGVGLVGGISYFMPKDAWIGDTEHDPGLWAYGMVTAGF